MYQIIDMQNSDPIRGQYSDIEHAISGFGDMIAGIVLTGQAYTDFMGAPAQIIRKQIDKHGKFGWSPRYSLIKVK